MKFGQTLLTQSSIYTTHPHQMLTNPNCNTCNNNQTTTKNTSDIMSADKSSNSFADSSNIGNEKFRVRNPLILPFHSPCPSSLYSHVLEQTQSHQYIPIHSPTSDSSPEYYSLYHSAPHSSPSQTSAHSSVPMEQQPMKESHYPPSSHRCVSLSLVYPECSLDT